MGKSEFAYGDEVGLEFFNSIFKDSSAPGYRHDGQDADGHLPKINLSSDAGPVKQEVTGFLPWANIMMASGTFTYKITTAYLAAEQTGTAKWVKIAGLAIIWFPVWVYGTAKAGTTDCKITILHANNFPTFLFLDDSESVISFPIGLIDGANTNAKSGFLRVDNTTLSSPDRFEWALTLPPSGFSDTQQSRGISGGFVIYKTILPTTYA
jgi:hypothetical protein